MTVLEAAREIGLSADCVYDLCKKGLLGHRRIGPNRGRIVILPAHVAAYLEKSEVTEANAPAASAQVPPKVPARAQARNCRIDGKPYRFTRDPRPDGKPYLFMK